MFSLASTAVGRGSRAASIAGAVLIGGLLAVGSPMLAGAAELEPGTVSSVSTVKSSYGYNEKFALDFAWAVPDAATTGDTFTLDLPAELESQALTPFDLKAPDGSVVAHATWNGKRVTFALTDYADTHQDVHGTGHLGVEWDHANTPKTAQPIVLGFASSSLTLEIGAAPVKQTAAECTTDCAPVTPKPAPTSRALSKSGTWADGRLEGSGDGDDLRWRVRLPVSADGFDGPISIVDAPNSNNHIECSSIALHVGARSAGSRGVVDPSRYTISCTETGFTVTLDEIKPNERISVDYTGEVAVPTDTEYSNSVAITTAAGTSEVSATVKRTEQGGDGVGDVPAAPVSTPVSRIVVPAAPLEPAEDDSAAAVTQETDTMPDADIAIADVEQTADAPQDATTTEDTAAAPATASSAAPATASTANAPAADATTSGDVDVPTALAHTGADSSPYLMLATFLLGGGALVLATARRRTARKS